MYNLVLYIDVSSGVPDLKSWITKLEDEKKTKSLSRWGKNDVKHAVKCWVWICHQNNKGGWMYCLPFLDFSCCDGVWVSVAEYVFCVEW